MAYLWNQLRTAVPLITGGNGYVWSVTWLTIKVALVSTAIAVVIGLPIGAALGIARSRGARLLQILANASLALPPVVVGLVVLLLLLPGGVFGSVRIEFSLPAVYVAQTVLALPYIVALTPAAIRGVEPGLLAQARALGARRHQVAILALRQARIGVLAAVIAALGSALAEVGAVIIVGGNIENHTQTLATAIVSEINDYGNYNYALAMTIVLLFLILLLLGTLGVLQQRSGAGQRLRFRPGTLPAYRLSET
jgi:tungstate transport system permease protein